MLLLLGKTIVGGLLGGLIGVEITKKIIKVNRSTGDVFVYPLIVAIAMGRVGCFLTGLSDKTYGVATKLPWGVDFGDGILRHPTQIYEIIFLIFLGIFLKINQKLYPQEGDLFKLFMIGYLAFRFVIDFLKPDFQIFLNLSAIQIACLCGLIYYFIVYYFRNQVD
jgi:phosphatidylglycerol---prolipoprotein diacylglyceryl transferase